MSAILSNNKNMEFYADILSDSDSGAGGSHLSFSARTESIHSTVKFFAQKRDCTKDAVLGIEGTNTMVITTTGQRPRGIRSWELAQSNAWELRQKIQRNQESIKQRTVRQQLQARTYAHQKQLEQHNQKQRDELALKQFQRQHLHHHDHHHDVQPIQHPMPIPMSSSKSKSTVDLNLNFKYQDQDEDNTAW